jgi:hypothetical protein
MPEGRDQVDAAVMPFLRRQRRSSSAPRTGLQPWQFHADTHDAQGGGAVVADQSAGEADQDRCQGRQPRPPRYVPNGRGRGIAADVQRHPDAYCPASGAACTSVRDAGIECDKQRRQRCAMRRQSNKFYAPRGGNPSIPLPAAPIAVRAFCNGGPKTRQWSSLVPQSEEKLFPKCELPHTSRPIPERCCLRVSRSGHSSGECRLTWRLSHPLVLAPGDRRSA